MIRMLNSVVTALTLWHSLPLFLPAGALVVWLGGLSLLIGNRRTYHSLSQFDWSHLPSDSFPTLSILVPACNEAETVERAMLSLLDLDYPCKEIIAVNDRSTDETGAILDRLAGHYRDLRVIHIAALPDGWLGKNHALHVASRQARGSWLLFTDADVLFSPQALRHAVGYAQERGLDHLVLSPRCETRGFWERLFVSYFSLMFSFRVRPWEAEDPRTSAFVGLGVFNLVRTSVYREFGGHAALPMDVCDDMKLGKVIKRDGYRTELQEGGDLTSVRWVVGLRGVIDGLTKNAFAGFDYKLGSALFAGLGLLITTIAPVAALFWPSGPIRLLGLASLTLMVAGAAAIRRVSQAGAQYGLAYPLASCILVYIILRSIWRAYRLDGIVWRGTLYSLKELKKNVV